MKYRDLVLGKIEKLTAQTKLIGYNIKRQETDTAFNLIKEVLDKIEDIESMIEREPQDIR